MSRSSVIAPYSAPSPEAFLVEASANYARTLARVLGSMFKNELKATSAELSQLGHISSHDIMVSLMFTGSFYGEFILSLNLGYAQMILGIAGESELDIREQCAEVLSEILNMVAGECFSSLAQEQAKLTLTAPKVFFGQMKYPKIQAAKAHVIFEGHEAIECILYMDKMKLDIDASYKTALGELRIVNRDLTETMDQLRSQQKHLIQSEKMVALGTMAAGVAHEINTPLSTILLVEEQIKELLDVEPVDKQKIFKMLSVIEATANKISKITKTLRFYASDNHGENFEMKSLEFIVQEALVPLRAIILQRNIRIIMDSSLSSVEIECRPLQLTEALYDLLHNSVYAISESSNRWIQVKCADRGDSVDISVIDSGLGILSENQEKVFDPFFTTKKFGEGVGLGLSHARGILIGHGGNIELRPLSKNTEFVIHLPKHQGQKAA